LGGQVLPQLAQVGLEFPKGLDIVRGLLLMPSRMHKSHKGFELPAKISS